MDDDADSEDTPLLQSSLPDNVATITRRVKRAREPESCGAALDHKRKVPRVV